MSLVAQNDTGDAAGANSYIDFAYYTTYFTDRGVAAALEFDQEEVEPASIAATDYMDNRWRFKGRRLNGQDQATEHPRACLYDREGCLIEGLHPNVLKACAEYTYRCLLARVSGVELLPDPTTDASGRAVIAKTTTVGPITSSVQYESGAALSQLIKPYPWADRLLRELVVPGGGVMR